MPGDETTPETDRTTRPTRRALLRSVAASTVAVGGLGLVGTAGAGRGNGNGNGDGGKGFPPNGITEYGGSVDLGDGQVRTFTTETPSGEPKYHGVEFDRAALDGLPSADELKNADEYDDKYGRSGETLSIHYKQSLEFFVPFPDAANTPFTFLGLNWNPGGHFGGKGAWLTPHFDVHFHMLDTETVDAVEGPRLPPYDTGNGEYEGGSPAPDPDGRVVDTTLDDAQIPAGYSRAPDPVADQRYITDMGEHTAPDDAPELPDGPDDTGDPSKFTNTLIQGFVGVGEGGQDPRLAFVEPMVTREYLRDVTGTEVLDVPQPAVYPHDRRHPQRYSVRDVPASDTVVVAIQGFESV